MNNVKVAFLDKLRTKHFFCQREIVEALEWMVHDAISTAQEMKFSFKDFFTWTEEIFNEKLDFFVQCRLSMVLVPALLKMKIDIFMWNYFWKVKGNSFCNISRRPTIGKPQSFCDNDCFGSVEIPWTSNLGNRLVGSHRFFYAFFTLKLRKSTKFLTLSFNLDFHLRSSMSSLHLCS